MWAGKQEGRGIRTEAYGVGQAKGLTDLLTEVSPSHGLLLLCVISFAGLRGLEASVAFGRLRHPNTSRPIFPSVLKGVLAMHMFIRYRSALQRLQEAKLLS